MSLHIAAKHLAAQGRGPDTTLVHMTPREVGGLQAIAKAHGGSLTINPRTGLAEAGFLSRILPTLAGAALASTGIGAPAAAMLVGGGTMMATGGDLKAGLVAGLGAYGGAGLGQGVFAPEAAPAEVAAPTASPTAAAPTPAPVPTPAPAPGGAAEAGYTPQVAQGTPLSEVQGLSAPSPNSFGNAPFEPRPGVTFDNYGQQGFGSGNASSLKPATEATTGTGTGWERVQSNLEAKPTYGLAAVAPMANTDRKALPEEEKYDGPLSKFSFDPDKYQSSDRAQPNPYYKPQRYNYAEGGTVEQMSNANAIGANTGYPMADLHQGAYATPWQTPIGQNVVEGTADTGVNRMTGEQSFAMGGIAQAVEKANGGGGGGGGNAFDGGVADQIRKLQAEGRFAAGGHLGGYSDGGRMLKGPGDGMSDSIPAKIGSKQPARLADGEFVVPADVVSHLGNGSSDAGAKQLYQMMDRIRAARTGKKKQAPQVKATKAMPA